MKVFGAILGTMLVASPALAGSLPVVDGTRAGDPYVQRATQTVQTQFGDNFSELNGAYATIKGGRLYVALTGNLESNFNKLNIFIDSQAGGQNVLSNDVNNGGTNPTNDGWAGKHAGMTFDTGFEADYMLIMRNGNFGGDRFDLDFAQLGTSDANSFAGYTDVFGGSLQGSASLGAPGSGNLTPSIEVAFNNSNVGGVSGGTGAANGAAADAVLTGIEFSIDLADIGNPSQLRISAMVNGSNHDFLSNQVLGGLPAGTGNLGGDGAGNFTGSLSGINFNNFAGDQHFFVPEPASLALLGLGGLVVLRRRR